jgi:hypothetical protein
MKNQSSNFKDSNGRQRIFKEGLSGVRNGRQGIVLTEGMLAFGVLSMAFAIILPIFYQAIEIMGVTAAYTQAVYLNEEQMEVAEWLRNEGWGNLNDGMYYVEPVSGSWTLVPTGTGEVVGNFTRWVEIGSMERDGSGVLVDSGGWEDQSSKRVVSHVEWSLPRPGEMEREMYLTRYLDNLAWLQTTQTEFDAGELDYTVTTNVTGGEFVLAGGECGSSVARSKIYLDQLENNWSVDPISSHTHNASLDLASGEQVYEGSYAMKIVFQHASSDSYVRIENKEGVCTKGFKFLKFYAYNLSETDDLVMSVRAKQSGWDLSEITIPKNPEHQWYDVPPINYSKLADTVSTSVTSLYFYKATIGGTDETFWVDDLGLSGGIEGGGGYFQEGTLTSQVFPTSDLGMRTFNRISWTEVLPWDSVTAVGFQLAMSLNADGPWLFCGPQGTSDPCTYSDMSNCYTTSGGSGVALNCNGVLNSGKYVRWKGYLFTEDGISSPIIEDVTVSYSP